MTKLFMNNDWEFIPEFTEEFLTDNSQIKTEKVRIPHTTKEVPYNYFDESMYQMLCGYRKIFTAPSEWKDKRIILTFDGVAHSAEVFLNGHKIGEHHCGYTAFSVELTSSLILGEENTLIVKVDSRENQNIPPFGFVIDYMTFGGIYRDVYIEVKEQEYIEDVFAHVEFDNKSILTDVASEAVLVTDITLNMKDYNSSAYYIRSYLIKDDKRILLGDKPVDDNIMSFNKTVKNVNLWSIDNPELYILEYELYKDTEIVDTYDFKFGFREIKFENDGFYLNRKLVKIRGLNRHQSYPYVGYAMPKSMQINDADILKNELGCNAVRTSHYPQSHYFIDRCDELGLLVFTEIPGWQHIGNEEWKQQAVKNVEDMVVQYRNHPSIILWGVRINESMDDDDFYRRTNEAAHKFDKTRSTGGVRCIKKSNLLEDVYTYNDFVHSGFNKVCEPKKNVTSDMNKPYFISEFNGHMFPTKSFDDEEHRREHAIRHARVLNAVAAEKNILGCFGWCMFDYNTHKDFGSGDRICYHGVMDMFRNPKLAASVYACEQEETPVLELSSSMDIGEHPACNRGLTYIFSNADSVKMYKNDIFIKEYRPSDSEYKNLKHGPIVIDDFIGDQLRINENFTEKQAKLIADAMNYAALHGYDNLPWKIKWKIIRAIVCYRMNPNDAIDLYTKYIGDWGGTSTVYRFEAIKDNKVVKTITKMPMEKLHLDISLSSDVLCEEESYDMASLRIRVLDQNGNLMHYYNETLELDVKGPIEVVGPKNLVTRGGMTGSYLKSKAEVGEASITIGNSQIGYEQINVKVVVSNKFGGDSDEA